MSSKRVIENKHLSTPKISRSTIITPFSTSITPVQSDELVSLAANPTDLDYTPVVIPDFFSDQNGDGSDTVFVESVPHTAFHQTLQEFDLTPKTQTHDLIKFLNSLAKKLEQTLPDLLRKHIGMKLWLLVRVLYSKIDDKTKIVEAYHKSKPFICLNLFQIRDQISILLEQLLTESAHFMRESSGLVYNNIVAATIQIAQHLPLVGEHYVELPNRLLKANAIVNVRNNDNRCFGYAVISALHPSTGDNPNRPKQYENFFQQHNLQYVQYPVSQNDIPAIEDMLQVRINLFTFSHEGLRKYPIYISTKLFDTEIDLLHWNGHFAWIKNFNRLIYNITKHHERKFICKCCLGHFSAESKLALHKQNCENGGYAGPIYTMPPPGKILKFINIRNELPLPFKIFADCEALTEKALNPAQASIYQNHIPCAVGFKLISSIPAVQIPYWQCRGENCVVAFLDRLVEIEKICVEYLFNNTRMIFTRKDEQDFYTAV
ncbi:MAG: hypothetical protein FD143_3284, partial [Ignavibacteria bacterium]